MLLVTPYYAPDLGPSSPLLTMLCEDLVRLGHEVTVVAAVPHMPTGQVSSQYRGRLSHFEERQGVEVHRVWVPSGDRRKLRHRALVFAVYQMLSAVIGLRRKYDVVLVTNPGIETAMPMAVLSLLRGKPAVFCVWDLYPDVGIHLGVFRSRLAIKLVSALETFCLLHAFSIQVLASSFEKVLVERGVPKERIVRIPPWLDTEFNRPLARENEVAKELGLSGYFVVMYAGNLGHSQGLECLLEAASLLKGSSRLRFVFVGDGAKKAELGRRAQTLRLSNVRFLPFQPREQLPLLLASADISVISLKKGVGRDSLPSKTFPILASGRPIIAAVDRGSDLREVIERAQAGVCVEPESSVELASAVRELIGSPALRARLGKNGREYVVRHHDRRVIARQFERLLMRACDSGEQR